MNIGSIGCFGLSIYLSTLILYGNVLNKDGQILLAQNFNDAKLPQQATFFCGLDDEDVPTTLAIGIDGNEYPIIKWITTFESREGRTPEERCNVVSANFQSSYNRGILKYLRGGRARNGLHTICVALVKDGPCVEALFTLPPGSYANQTVKRLWELSEGVRGSLYQTGHVYYLDIEDLVPLSKENTCDASVQQ